MYKKVVIYSLISSAAFILSEITFIIAQKKIKREYPHLSVYLCLRSKSEQNVSKVDPRYLFGGATFGGSKCRMSFSTHRNSHQNVHVHAGKSKHSDGS